MSYLGNMHVDQLITKSLREKILIQGFQQKSKCLSCWFNIFFSNFQEQELQEEYYYY